jgi:1-pyrroline-5-carboxylate dehydrogenase
MVTQEQDEKITYTTMGVEQAEAFNRRFEDALARAQAQLGKVYPAYVNGQAISTGNTFEVRSPDDTRMVLGAFQECGPEYIDQAVRAARAAFEVWSHTPWRERVAILRKAAAMFRSRKYELGAWLTLEAGKPRLEAIGEVEEAADLIDTYCGQMEEHGGFVLKLNQLSTHEVNYSVLRPYGVFAVISPFNFPAALSTGMLAGALVAGNTAVFKPAPETPLTGLKAYECLVEAGLPAGVINVITGRGDDTGRNLVSHAGVDGVAFIGSRAVGTHIYSEFSRERPRPVIAEMGGKNPAIVTRNADLDKAVEGTVRAAFGYSGQKCSAASRVYVDEEIADEFVRRLQDRTTELTVGNPARDDVFMGPVITEDAYRRFTVAANIAKIDGEIIAGGEALTDGDLRYGYYCTPTIASLPTDHPFFGEELFVPFLVVGRVSSLGEALRLANDTDYGLTAGIYTEDEEEQRIFLDRIEAGVVYVNRKAGATTGAWPGVQSFGGWKASGSTGKSALGPYYVQQFMHEQSQTVVTE